MFCLIRRVSLLVALVNVRCRPKWVFVSLPLLLSLGPQQHTNLCSRLRNDLQTFGFFETELVLQKTCVQRVGYDWIHLADSREISSELLK